MPPVTEKVGLVVVRAWTEGASSFRARVTVVPDVAASEEQVVVVGSPDEVVTLVRDWLNRFHVSAP